MGDVASMFGGGVFVEEVDEEEDEEDEEEEGEEEEFVFMVVFEGDYEVL